MPTDAELRAARDATIRLPHFPPFIVVNRLAAKNEGWGQAPLVFRWVVVDSRDQICFVGEVGNRETADARAAALNEKGH